MEVSELARRYVISTFVSYESKNTQAVFPPLWKASSSTIWINVPFHNAVISFLFFFPEHYATVALNFVPIPGQTELQLDCKGVPVCKEENMKFCWQKQHFEEIKGLLQLTTLNGWIS